MAACSSPLASAGLDGITTLSPGVWAYQASWLWECWAAAPVPDPNGSRTTMGTLTAPPSMNHTLAAWLTSWSMAWAVKSENCSSATGRMPHRAAPTAAPTIASSAIGVSRIRSAPKRSSIPVVTPKAPP
jgi:hypothetical protein